MSGRHLTVDPADYDTTDAVRTVDNLGAWWQLLLDQNAALHDLEPGRRFASAVAEAATRLGVGPGEPLEQLPKIHAALRPPIEGELRAAIDGLLVGGLGAIHTAGRLLAEGRAPLVGSVAQLNTSGGGVPKLPVAEVAVGRRGLAGDRQRSRVHHGRPWQALCLWSAEVIEAFRADGHPIHPGAAGENVTVTGIDWSQVKPGMQVALGDDVVAELSMWALPCTHNAQWFSDGDFGRMHHERGPVSRIYASVLREGSIGTGDRVVIHG